MTLFAGFFQLIKKTLKRDTFFSAIFEYFAETDSKTESLGVSRDPVTYPGNR